MKDEEKQNPDNIPVSALVSKRGIKTASDYADFMSALMGDLVEGKIDPRVAGAACAAGEQLLEVAKLQLEYNDPLQLGSPWRDGDDPKKLKR